MWEPGAQGKITRWNQVDPSWPDAPIKLFGAGADSGTFRLLHRGDRRQGQVSRGDYTASRTTTCSCRACSATSTRSATSGFAYYAENQGKLKSVPVIEKSGKPGVKPSMETVLDGSYQPLARPIFIYVNAKSLERPEVKKFVEYYMTHGSKLAREVKYVPLPTRPTR